MSPETLIALAENGTMPMVCIGMGWMFLQRLIVSLDAMSITLTELRDLMRDHMSEEK